MDTAMTHVDSFDNESGLLTGVGLLAALPPVVVAIWSLERAEREVGFATVDPISGIVAVATAVAWICFLIIALTAFQNADL